jgi:hypothetical protein
MTSHFMFNEIEMIFFNHLTTIDEIKSFVIFPASLKRLYIYDNKIDVIPELPQSLLVLILSNTSIPMSLIDEKKLPLCKISINNDEPRNEEISDKIYIYTEDTIKIPETIETLIISNIKIDTLPMLPKNLKKLIIKNTSITRLKNLPKNLEVLDATHNKIEYIDKFPSTLTNINISLNNLKTIPEIPLNTIEFSCSCNKLEKFPYPHKNMKKLYASRNPFTEKVIIDFKNDLSLEELKISECNGVCIISLNEGLRLLSLHKCNLKFFSYADEITSSFSVSAHEIQFKQIFPNSLEYLNLSHNNLDFMPLMPLNLIDLIINNNNIKTLPIINPKLKHLYCKCNKIKKISNVTKSLIYIYCDKDVKIDGTFNDELVVCRNDTS